MQRDDDLSALIDAALARVGVALQSGDVLVLAQKIVSKAEGRLVHLRDVTPSGEAQQLGAEIDKDPRLVQLILDESDHVLRTRPGLIVVQHRLGFVCANAGIDHSNVADADDAYLLLPADPDGSADALRAKYEQRGVALGVLIIDSHGRAWRNGTVGLTIGLAGLPGVVDLRGEEDLFGYELRVSEVATADELAAAASLMMGQASEGIPVVHVRGFPYALRDADLSELLRPAENDLFR